MRDIVTLFLKDERHVHYYSRGNYVSFRFVGKNTDRRHNPQSETSKTRITGTDSDRSQCTKIAYAFLIRFIC